MQCIPDRFRNKLGLRKKHFGRIPAFGKEFRRLTKFRTSRTQALDMPFIRHYRTPLGKPDRLRNSLFQLIQSETLAAADSAYAPDIFGRNIFQLFSRRPAIRQITFVYYENYISAIHAENFLNESLILLRYARRTVKQQQHTFCGSGFVQSTFNSDFFNRIAGFVNARRIGNANRQTEQIDFLFQNIACCARNVCNDCTFRIHQCI